MSRALMVVSLVLTACGVGHINESQGGSAGGSAAGGGGGAGGGDAGAIVEGAGDAGNDAGSTPLPCPIVNGIDGVGVCGAWTLGSWDSDCTQGYTRVRTCDARYDCRVSDHNGCAAALNVGGAAPAGCGQCPGGSGGGGGSGTLKYFGYWRDSDIQNYVCQIQDHANFSMTNDSQGIVDLAASYGVANFGLTAPSSGAPAPLNAVVVRDDADVGAYGWCANHPCPNGIIDGWNAVKQQVEQDGAAIRQQHPGAHLMINLGDGDANGKLDFQNIPGFTLPNGVDWVGLECYTGAANCQANLNVLKPLLPPGARTWIITAGTSGYGTEAWLVADAQAMYDFAKNDPSVIGLIVFVWAKTILCPPDCQALAVKEMPTLLAKYREIGDAITGRTSIDPKPDSACPPP